MKIRRSPDYIHIDLTGAEAAVLLEELENVPGGSKMPKLRQICEELRSSLRLDAAMVPSKFGPKRKPMSSEVHTAAQDLGHRGGLKGGPARAAALSADERSKIAKKAAEARWGLRAVESVDDPPRVHDVEHEQSVHTNSDEYPDLCVRDAAEFPSEGDGGSLKDG